MNFTRKRFGFCALAAGIICFGALVKATAQYKVKISTGERTLVRKNTERITGWLFDFKDQLRRATRSADNGDAEVMRVDANGFTKVYSCNDFESCGSVRYHKDGRRVYFETNKGAGIDLTRLELFDPATGKEERSVRGEMFIETDN